MAARNASGSFGRTWIDDTEAYTVAHGDKGVWVIVDAKNGAGNQHPLEHASERQDTTDTHQRETEHKWGTGGIIDKKYKWRNKTTIGKRIGEGSVADRGKRAVTNTPLHLRAKMGTPGE